MNKKKTVIGAVVAAVVLALGITAAIQLEKKQLKSQVWHLESGSKEAGWTVGFGAHRIIPADLEENPLYIAGYDSDRKTSLILDNSTLEVYGEYPELWQEDPYDYGQARAVFLSTEEGGTLFLGIDCVAISGNYVDRIREALSDVSKEKNCVTVNVYATHSHAMPDTLGLWGPLGIDGKEEAYMELLVEAAIRAGTQALEETHKGRLYYGSVEIEESFLRDSRYPFVFDPDLHQIRFEGEDGYGVRMYFYGAHAESMRGANRILSRDFPGVLCDLVTAETGDQTLFLPGAIGGLLMTQEFVQPFDAVENLQITGKALAEYALSITPESEEELQPVMQFARTEISVPLDNNAFLYYQFLGILKCNAVKGESRTGYHVRSEMALVRLDSLSIALIPGEIFPELVYGGKYGFAASEKENPTALVDICAEYGMDGEKLLIIGLANDELGYIVPPSDFLVHRTNPYLQKTMDTLGENHYEETNSVGPECANVIADGFRKLAELLQ